MLYLEDWEFNMKKSDVERKVARMVMAGRRALDPSFRAYWKHSASKLATKYNVSLSEIEQCPEFYDESKVSSVH